MRVPPDCDMVRAGFGDLWLYHYWTPVGIGGHYPTLWFTAEAVS